MRSQSPCSVRKGATVFKALVLGGAGPCTPASCVGLATPEPAAAPASGQAVGRRAARLLSLPRGEAPSLFSATGRTLEKL